MNQRVDEKKSLFPRENNENRKPSVSLALNFFSQKLKLISQNNSNSQGTLPKKKIEFKNEEDALYFEITNSLYIETFWLSEGYFEDKYADSKSYQLLNKKGFRCNVSLSSFSDDFVKLHISFRGTIDFASKYANLDMGSPGQDIFKKHEAELIKKLNEILVEIHEIYPNKPIYLQICGFSLGGALAKCLTHSVQRMKILSEFDSFDENKMTACFQRLPDGIVNKDKLIAHLLSKLKVDSHRFNVPNAGLAGFKQLASVSLYTIGAPGVSYDMDRDASALSYLHPIDFIKTYYHFHKQDLIRRFGEAELFSGECMKPNVEMNKTIIYDTVLTEKKIANAPTLPFPYITKIVMTAHLSAPGDNATMSQVYDTSEFVKNQSEVKFKFSPLRWAIYRQAFFIGSLIAMGLNVGLLKSLPETEPETPSFKI
jgi:hypothetical protein